MPTNPGSIPAPTLPAPDPGDKPTFAARMRAELAWLRDAMYTAINSVASASYTNAVEAAASAQTAIDAAAGVAAPAWSAGAYTVGQARYSPGNQLLYRCIADVSGSTDPKDDPTHWQIMWLDLTKTNVTGTTHTAAHGTRINIKTAGAACLVTMPTITAGFRCEVNVYNGRFDNAIDWGGADHEESTTDRTYLSSKYERLKIWADDGVWRISRK